MSKAQPDPPLQKQAQTYLEKCNGNVMYAAKTLGINYHFFRRFVTRGRASEPNRLALQAALDSQPSPPQVPISAMLRSIVQTRGTLDLTRAVLSDLLAAVDALEAGRLEQEQVGQ